jgi:glycosyltransferase involved in cell wall biosynthesis
MLSKKFGNHFEGFGIVYLEALFYGLPIIVSQESGARDLLKVSNKIKVFKPLETIKIASYILNLFKYQKKINPLTYRNILDKHFKINKLKLKKFYDKLVK